MRGHAWSGYTPLEIKDHVFNLQEEQRACERCGRTETRIAAWYKPLAIGSTIRVRIPQRWIVAANITDSETGIERYFRENPEAS